MVPILNLRSLPDNANWKEAIEALKKSIFHHTHDSDVIIRIDTNSAQILISGASIIQQYMAEAYLKGWFDALRQKGN